MLEKTCFIGHSEKSWRTNYYFEMINKGKELHYDFSTWIVLQSNQIIGKKFLFRTILADKWGIKHRIKTLSFCIFNDLNIIYAVIISGCQYHIRRVRSRFYIYPDRTKIYIQMSTKKKEIEHESYQVSYIKLPVYKKYREQRDMENKTKGKQWAKFNLWELKRKWCSLFTTTAVI